MTIATLGPEGTFSHEIAARLGAEGIELLPTIRSVFRRVAAGGADGIVPLENSLAGGVGATLDCLYQFEVTITGEAFLRIRHHLVGSVTPERMEVLYVHPQTHEQCSEWIERIGVPVVHTASNAASAGACARTPRSGAITSVTAAGIHHLPVIASDVQDAGDNVTRFVRIASDPAPCSNPAKCSILIDPETDRTGLLHDLLRVFADRAINLTKIESRPARRGMGTYIFFLDVAASPGWQDALLDLGAIARVRNLGCYPDGEVYG
ncbi:MAG TPA: ACT domain-containing protein [Methanoculleus sp.]|nr:ACT domain-containing protein [Methanoculleus sp.]